ncbi:MAG: hypothetical protein ABI721_00415 [Candidatus Dojkabacteria bacterium]
MKNELSVRQKELLISIIKEFIDTAEAVGSISLQSKFNLKLSTATIRNEMAELVDKGYLYQKHLSSGRIPTTKGWRFFVDYLKELGMDEIDPIIKAKIRKALLNNTDSFEEIIRNSLSFLTEISENAAVALIGKELYYSGLSELVSIPEFRDTDNLKRILSILEDYNTLSEMLNKDLPDDDIQILIGEETGNSIFSEYSLVFSEVRIDGKNKGCVAVIGPNRMRYDKVIKGVKYITDTLRSILPKAIH